MKVNVISFPYIFQVLYVLCFTRPRYQVSAYRTIGPLVRFSHVNKRYIPAFVVVVVVLGFYVPPTAKVIRRRDLGLKSHPKDWRSPGSNSRRLVYKAGSLTARPQRLPPAFVSIFNHLTLTSNARDNSSLKVLTHQTPFSPHVFTVASYKRLVP